MKFFTLSFIFFLVFLVSCANTNDSNDGYSTSDGQIIGADPRMCACCGGWYVDISKDTLRIWNMPEDFNKVLSTKEMPVNVRLNWKRMTDGCGATMKNIILVNSINLR